VAMLMRARLLGAFRSVASVNCFAKPHTRFTAVFAIRARRGHMSRPAAHVCPRVRHHNGEPIPVENDR
jgi:hypothetical protein